MSDLAVRFLHASDFQLDQPLRGLTEIPDHLREVLIDAPYRAAERVFETALSEQVSFLCLSGDLLDLTRVNPRSVSFLREQFERLAGAGIPVYWASRQQDPARMWPREVRLPDSVHCFTHAAPETRAHETNEGFVATLVGCGGTAEVSAADFAAPASGQYCVALLGGAADEQAMGKRDIDYWALGGQLDRKTLFSQPTVAHYCGTPQGRHFRNTGPHGCTLVDVKRPRETHLRFVPCDLVRWHHERLRVPAGGGWSELEDILAQRVGEIRSQMPTIVLLVRWTFTAADGFVDPEATATIANKASNWLKKQYGYHAESCWPVAVDVDVHQPIPASAYEEDTLLGDYLRSVRELRDGGRLATVESPCIPRHFSEELHWLTDLSDSKTRGEVLTEATHLGAALLRGEKPAFSALGQP
ncbi:MAG: metallophosphoesterase family protein [Planctomycetota bacterium]